MCDIKKFWRLHYSEVVRSGGITTMLHTTLDDAKEEQRRLITGRNTSLPITIRPVFVIVDDDGQVYEINTYSEPALLFPWHIHRNLYLLHKKPSALAKF